MSCYIVGLLIVVLIGQSKSADLPSHFKTCSRRLPNFSECISNAATEAIISMAQGLKSFKILPLEPLEIDGVSIGDNGGAVSLKQIYKNVKLHGLTKGLKVQYDPISSDTHDLVLRSKSFNDQVDFVADYTMTGKILLLPIRGNGRANVTMQGLESTNTMYCERYEKNGERYLRITKYECEFSPRKVLFNFTNLFNGDPVLSKQMNKFLNENSNIVFKETQEAFQETFGLVFAKIANNIFSRVPSKKIFPE